MSLATSPLFRKGLARVWPAFAMTEGGKWHYAFSYSGDTREERQDDPLFPDDWLIPPDAVTGPAGELMCLQSLRHSRSSRLKMVLFIHSAGPSPGIPCCVHNKACLF